MGHRCFDFFDYRLRLTRLSLNPNNVVGSYHHVIASKSAIMNTKKLDPPSTSLSLPPPPSLPVSLPPSSLYDAHSWAKLVLLLPW